MDFMDTHGFWEMVKNGIYTNALYMIYRRGHLDGFSDVPSFRPSPKSHPTDGFTKFKIGVLSDGDELEMEWDMESTMSRRIGWYEIEMQVNSWVWI